MTNAATLNEIKLTIESTEALYGEALAVRDFSIEGDDMTSLFANTLLQIERNTSQPANASDDEAEFMAQADTVIETVKQLQKRAA